MWSTKTEFFGLLETKVKSKKRAKVKEAFVEGWESFSNNDHVSVESPDSIWVGGIGTIDRGCPQVS